VDPLTQIRLTRDLIDIDSTTGEEAAAGTWLAATLDGLGYDVTTQLVVGDRFNVIARRGEPELVFSTHFDCVPPFTPSREADGRLYGRGACDAKGILLAQVAAAERLSASGETRVGLLFVVGEERGSEGARAANDLAPGSRFLVNGEPTGNRLGLATRGVYRARLDATGRAAHSSRPELGESAIDALVDALVTLRSVSWPDDPELGRTFYTTGMIAGGIAPNVISPEADAELTFRTVGPHDEVRRLIERHVGPAVAVEDVLVVPPIRLTTVPGFEAEVFSYTTDIPFLDRWGAPLLLGPGTVVEAHTDDEHVEIGELHRAVDLYERLARELLATRTSS
jgi:acetylornithine deacetylase